MQFIRLLFSHFRHQIKFLTFHINTLANTISCIVGNLIRVSQQYRKKEIKVTRTKRGLGLFASYLANWKHSIVIISLLLLLINTFTMLLKKFVMNAPMSCRTKNTILNIKPSDTRARSLSESNHSSCGVNAKCQWNEIIKVFDTNAINV